MRSSSRKTEVDGDSWLLGDSHAVKRRKCENGGSDTKTDCIGTQLLRCVGLLSSTSNLLDRV